MTPYQRGHRDALRALASEIDALEHRERDKRIEHGRRRSTAMQVLARLRRGGLSPEDAEAIMAAFAYPEDGREWARLALRRAEALPHDPEEEG